MDEMQRRVFLGGLPRDTNAKELRERFGRTVQTHDSQCKLKHVELPRKNGIMRGFAYLTLEGAGAERMMETVVKAYNKTKWRSCVLRVEPATPEFTQKLEAEWKDAEDKRVAAEAKVREFQQRMSPVKGPVVVRPAVFFTGSKRTSFEDLDEVVKLGFATQQVVEMQEEAQVEATDDEVDSGAYDEEKSEADDEEESSEEDESEELADGEETESEAEASEAEEEQAFNDEAGEAFAQDAALAMDDVESFVQQVERDEANARRIAALEAKKKQKKQEPTIGKIDVTAGSSKKIKFSDSDEEDHESAEDGEEGAVTNWLDSSDDDEEEDEHGIRRIKKSKATTAAKDFFGEEAEKDDDEDAAKAFALRPEFLGESGKQLFEMQKRFGGDQRFRLDARFMEDEFGGMDDLMVDDTEDIDADAMQVFCEEDDETDAAHQAQEMMEEQDTALAVVLEIFPDVDIDKIKYRLRVKSKKDPIKDASWMGNMKRYDPRDEVWRRQELELPMDGSSKGSKKRQRGGDPSDDEDKAPSPPQRKSEKEVLIGGDRFFAASSGMKSLFTRVRKNSEDGMEGEAALDGVFGFNRPETSAGGGEGATFKMSSLFDIPLDKDTTSLGAHLLEEDEDTEPPPAPASAWSFNTMFNQNEDEEQAELTDGENKDDENDVEVDESGQEPSKKKPRIQRSVTEFIDFGRTFVKSTGEAAATEKTAWPELRKKLTLDFKRKRKDALKHKKQQQKLQSKKQQRAANAK